MECVFVLLILCTQLFSNGTYQNHKFIEILSNLLHGLLLRYLILCDFGVVCGDVSSLDGVKTFASTTAATSPENGNSFSILTKAFLNKPDGGDADKRKPNKPQTDGKSSPRFGGNNLAETDDSDERQAYYYDKPKIPFELPSEVPESTNIHTNTVPPKK